MLSAFFRNSDITLDGSHEVYMIFKWRILIFRDAEAGFDEIARKRPEYRFFRIQNWGFDGLGGLGSIGAGVVF